MMQVVMDGREAVTCKAKAAGEVVVLVPGTIARIQDIKKVGIVNMQLGGRYTHDWA